MKSQEFTNISIRGRVAFAILCLEKAIIHFGFDIYDWSFVLNLLWSITNTKLGSWHYPLAECTGRSIINDEGHLDDLEFLTKEKFWELNKLYKNANHAILRMIDLIFEISTRDLYASIVNASPDTLKYLQEIIDMMNQNEIPLPDAKLFQKFPITENEGWGREFSRDEIYNGDNI
ncbi:MAG TPA: hypothetical protein VIM75_24575 [Ohtaekwangia sp.]